MKGHGCKWTWETIKHYTQIKVKEQLAVRMDVNKHERPSNITLRHKLK
jgi:hypothetical protein